MTPLRRFAAPAALILLATLAGCAVPRPPATPVAAAPPQWHAPLPHNGNTQDLTRWWQQFADPLLTDLVEAAQNASPSVAAARSRIDQARAARNAAAAALQPSLDAQAAVQRGNAQPPAPLATSWQAGLLAGWELDLYGGNQAAVDAAQARLAGAQAGWHEARVSMAAETAGSYLNLRTCRQQAAVAERDAASRAETARLSALGVQAGFTAPAQAALARASAAEGAARATQQRTQCELELKALVALTGLAEPTLRQRLAGGWQENPGFVGLTVARLPAEVLAQRPDLYRAEQEVAAASADVGQARAQRYPRLSLSGSIAAAAVRTGGDWVDVQTWSIGPLALSLPLLDAGRRAASEDAAVARYETAAAQYQERVRHAVREVEQALVGLDSARARDADLRAAAEGYRASFAATEARYRGGLASLIELEDQRRVALAADLALVQLQRERLAAWIALYRAVGGGWSRPQATTARTGP